MDLAALHALDARPRTDLRSVLVERRAAARGLMAPLHTRAESEAYYVLEGALTLFVGADAVAVKAGETVIVPADRARTFRVESDGARWLVATRTPSPAHYEHFGRAVAPPTPAFVADDLAALTAIVASAGIDVLGPPGALPADLVVVA